MHCRTIRTPSDPILTHEWRTTEWSSPYSLLIHDSCPERVRVMTFASQQGLQELPSSHIWFMDSTFSSASHPESTRPARAHADDPGHLQTRQGTCRRARAPADEQGHLHTSQGTRRPASAPAVETGHLQTSRPHQFLPHLWNTHQLTTDWQ